MQSQHPSTSSIEMNNVVSVTRPSGTSETRHPLQPPPPQQHHHYPVIQQPISSGDFRLPGAPPQSHSQKPQQAAPAAHIVSSSTCSPPSAQSNVIMRPPPPPPPLPLKISRTFSSAPQDVKPSHQEEPTSSIPDLVGCSQFPVARRYRCVLVSSAGEAAESDEESALRRCSTPHTRRSLTHNKVTFLLEYNRVGIVQACCSENASCARLRCLNSDSRKMNNRDEAHVGNGEPRGRLQKVQEPIV